MNLRHSSRIFRLCCNHDSFFSASSSDCGESLCLSCHSLNILRRSSFRSFHSSRNFCFSSRDSFESPSPFLQRPRNPNLCGLKDSASMLLARSSTVDRFARSSGVASAIGSRWCAELAFDLAWIWLHDRHMRSEHSSQMLTVACLEHRSHNSCPSGTVAFSEPVEASFGGTARTDGTLPWPITDSRSDEM